VIAWWVGGVKVSICETIMGRFGLFWPGLFRMYYWTNGPLWCISVNLVNLGPEPK
jgi:hypothetical protein